jgi:leucyl aminopeptidase
MNKEGVVAEKEIQRKRTYLVPDIHRSFIPADAEVQKINDDPALFITHLDSEQVLILARSIHGKNSLCGGFLDVEQEWAKGKLRYNDVFSGWTRISDGEFSEPQRHRFRRDLVDPVLAKLSTDTMLGYLQKIVSFEGRRWDSAGGIGVARWAEKEMRDVASAHGGKSEILRKSLVLDPDEQFSVMARIQGAKSDLPGVVLGAHIDSIFTKDGADDDASGAAVVMAVYRALLESGISFERDIHFMLYAAEEVGLRGSHDIVNAFASKNMKMLGVMQLDMIGFSSRSSERELFFVIDETNTALTKFTKSIAREYLGAGVVLDDTELKAPFTSDHATWSRAGYSTVFPFEARSEDMNPRIHTDGDTIDQLSPARMRQFLVLAAAFVVEMASL